MEPFIHEILASCMGENIKIKNVEPIGGGCIHNARKIETDRGRFFLKFNYSLDEDMFRKEFLGLKILKEAGEISVPEPLHSGSIGGKAYLLTEFVNSSGKKYDFWIGFGTSLARLHKNHLHTAYGLDHDNYIGRLPQKNDFKDNWLDFFIRMRLEKQIMLAVENKLIDVSFAEKFRKLYKVFPGILLDEPPSLLHGDLWSGNYMTGKDGMAVLIDPAVYYGNREIELSFTHMFGGFDPEFYRSYHSEFPLSNGFEDRIDIYNLYPSLVHTNLFGTSYLDGVNRVIRKFT